MKSISVYNEDFDSLEEKAEELDISIAEIISCLMDFLDDLD